MGGAKTKKNIVRGSRLGRLIKVQDQNETKI